MKKATLFFTNTRLKPSQIHKLRGYVGTVFKQYDLIHNHDAADGRVIYRYPLIQFKRIGQTPAIIAITDRAVDLFADLFMKLDSLHIDGCDIPVHEKNLKVEKVDFGYARETFAYSFASPWMALNQHNFKAFTALETAPERNALLQRILIGNLLSMSKYLGVHIAKDRQLNADIQLKPETVRFKGQQMIGFRGLFKTNFIIPDHLGLGKSVSRGFGTVTRLI